MDSKNKENVKDETDYMKMLENFECPFTWEMDDITKALDVQYQANDDEDFLPLLKLMHSIMTLFVNMANNENSDTILENLEKCDDNMIALKENEDPEISTDAAYYVLQATQCFVFQKLGMKDKLRKILAKIKSVDTMNDKEKSTLIACQSIAWSKYHRIGTEEAIQFIREAINKNGRCALWHFILGKNLRRKRRDSSINCNPSQEELNCFLKAYEMTNNPVYGIFLAQSYRENRERRKAVQLYQRIYQNNIAGTTTLLRLALGFIQLKNFDLAKMCLDKVAVKCPTHSMYLHYQGLYYFKQNQYNEAEKFFEKAINGIDNLPAEKQYLQCMIKMNKFFDTTKYLENLVHKYETLPEKQIQPIILDLAFSYWKKDNNIKQALKYFLHAIDVDPKARCLTDYYSFNTILIKDKNVFLILKRDLLPLIQNEATKFDDDTVDIVDSLKEYCDKYYHSESTSMENCFSRFKF